MGAVLGPHQARAELVFGLGQDCCCLPQPKLLVSCMWCRWQKCYLCVGACRSRGSVRICRVRCWEVFAAPRQVSEAPDEGSSHGTARDGRLVTPGSLLGRLRGSLVELLGAAPAGGGAELRWCPFIWAHLAWGLLSFRGARQQLDPWQGLRGQLQHTSRRWAHPGGFPMLGAAVCLSFPRLLSPI